LAVVLAAACVVWIDPFADAVVAALGCCVLVAVSVTDLERRIIPNRVVLPALAVALVVQTARQPGVEWLAAAVAAGGFFLGVELLTRGGVGMGDVKLAAFLGAWLGRDVALALLVGSFAAAVPALVVLLRSGAAGRKQGLPYGPFLAFGGVVAVFATAAGAGSLL
jgi:prepilin signal peptidase PulO-like enzyme (type II secretory pathway)